MSPTPSPTHSPTTDSPTTNYPTSHPTENNNGDCDVNTALNNDDCDEIDDEPSNQCSIAIDLSFDVCYIGCYQGQRDQLWQDSKNCLCQNLFLGTLYDDNNKQCFIEQYSMSDLLTTYINDDTSNNMTNCTLQQSFQFQTAIFNADCNYIQSIFTFLEQQIQSAATSLFLIQLRSCNLFQSRQINSHYPDGFGAIADLQIELDLRDQSGSIVNEINVSKCNPFKVAFTFIMVFMMSLLI